MKMNMEDGSVYSEDSPEIFLENPEKPFGVTR